MFEQCLYFNTNALARTVTRLWTEAYKPLDLSPPHAFLLRLILARPGLMPRELAQELRLSRSTVTRFLDALEQRNYLERKITAQDGRELQVYPTQKAIAIHQTLDQIGQDLSARMQKLFGQGDLLNTISKLRDFQQLLDK